MYIPDYAKTVLDRLNGAGYEAYAVGGSVRDSLLGVPVNDWDVTTSALPEETEQVFRGFRVIETGIRHGTVTVVSEGHNIEITTYRCDGAYADNRHPENVVFVRDIKEDLLRRDFTVNAMAYSPRDGLRDVSGGMKDLEDRVIRAVGDAHTRFSEDGLRVMRAVRFASQLCFTIESATRDAVLADRHLLKNISSERLFSELKKTLAGRGVTETLKEYGTVISTFIPELVPLTEKDTALWEQTCRAAGTVKNDTILRLAVLFSSVGKDAAAEALARLKADRKTAETVTLLVGLADAELPRSKPQTRRMIHGVGEENLVRLLDLRRAMSAAAGDTDSGDTERISAWISEIAADGDCVSLKSLAVGGKDVLSLGVRPEDVGTLLNAALYAVMDERLPNRKNELMTYIKNLVSEEMPHEKDNPA